MGMSAEIRRKIKAVLVVAMVAVAEVRRIQQDVRFNDGLNLMAGYSANKADGTGVKHDVQLRRTKAHWNLQESGKLPFGQAGTIVADPTVQGQANLLDHQAMAANIKVQEQVNHIAEQIEVLMVDWSSDKEAKLFAKQIETTLVDASILEGVNRVAKQLQTLKADPNFREHARRLTKQIGPISEQSSRVQERRIGEQIESMIADPQIQAQARLVAEQIQALKDDKAFKKQSKLLAEQLQALAADSNFQNRAKRVARQMKAMLDDPTLRERAKGLAQHIQAMKADTTFRQSAEQAREHPRLAKLQLGNFGSLAAFESRQARRRSVGEAPSNRPRENYTVEVRGFLDKMLDEFVEKESHELPAQAHSIDVKPELKLNENIRSQKARGFTEKLVDNLLDRMLKASFLYHAKLHNTTLGKSSRLLASSRMSLWSIPFAASFKTRPWNKRETRAIMPLSIRRETACDERLVAPCKRRQSRRQVAWPLRSTKQELAAAEEKTDILRLGISLAAAAAFCLGIFVSRGATSGQEWLAGYLTEQSLSIDNLLVFILVFDYFQVAEGEPQKRILSYGIWGAAFLRAVCVSLGVEVLERFEPVLLVFASILVFSSYKILAAGDEDEDEDLSENAIVRACKSVIPVSDNYEGAKFFTLAADGTRIATPLLLVLAVIELSDLVFAVDSIPAVFGITRDPLIVYTSNMFAIITLRSLYNLIAKRISDLRFLDKAVGIILGFIGLKIIAGFRDVEVPTEVSLAVVSVLLAGGVGLSLAFPEEDEDRS